MVFAGRLRFAHVWWFFQLMLMLLFIGDTIYVTNGEGSETGDLLPHSAVIGDGPEFCGFWTCTKTFDFDEDTLSIYTGGVGTGSWSTYPQPDYRVFTGFNTVITGLSIQSNDGFSGSLLSDFSFTSNSITLNKSYGSYEASSLLVFNIETVPIPSTVWLFTSGLIGLIGFARRKA